MLRILVLMNTLSMDAREKLADLLSKLERDESGATIIEYSLLIGLITVAVVATIVIIGNWVASQWSSLQSAVSAS